MWNAGCPVAPSVRSLLLTVAVALPPLAAGTGWGAEPPASPPAAAQPKAAPAPAVPDPGGAAPAGSPTGTPTPGEKPPAGGAKTGGPGTGDAETAAPKRPHERLVFDCDSASSVSTTCAAIAAGSDAGCRSIKDQKMRDRCVSDTSYFLAAKNAPADSSWRFPDSWMQWCGKDKDTPTGVCEALRDAVRSGDPSKCKNVPADASGFCRALAGPDPSLCGDDKECRELADRSALVAKGGLKALVDEARNPIDKSYARAALGDSSSCTDLVAATKSPCAAARASTPASDPAPSGPPPTQPAPPAPAPSAPPAAPPPSKSS